MGAAKGELGAGWASRRASPAKSTGSRRLPKSMVISLYEAVDGAGGWVIPYHSVTPGREILLGQVNDKACGCPFQMTAECVPCVSRAQVKNLLVFQ